MAITSASGIDAAPRKQTMFSTTSSKVLNTTSVIKNTGLM